MANNFNNELTYPKMTRQREESIQSQLVAYAEDVNAEFDHIVDTYNRLIMMLTGEWGDDTGRIYELVDEAISTANEALTKANNAVQKTGDTMTGQLNIALVPASDYNVVNKKYVDETIENKLADPINRIEVLEDFKENLNATQVKLENEHFTGKNVNDGMNELFISVSSGKSTVAAAITGKGVPTAADASFSQMADNINSILTFTDGTAGGTATAGDILSGKTAYARGQLIVGTYVPIDTSDATATSAEILAGYTAYVVGGKVVGTYVPDGGGSGGPTYGTDTSNATATAADIAKGKTAYARGQYLVGTMNANPDVTEIYGPNVSGFSAIRGSNYIGELAYDNVDAVESASYIAYSKNMNYAIRVDFLAKDKGDNSWNNRKKFVIDVFKVGTGGLILEATAGSDATPVYRKFRYTKEELGIGETEEVTGLAIGPTGVLSYPELSLCYLTTRDTSDNKNYLYVFTFDQTEQGVLIKLEGRSYPPVKIKYQLPSSPQYWSGGTEFPFTPNTYEDVCCMFLGSSGSGRYYVGIRWIKVSMSYISTSDISIDIFVYDDMASFNMARGGIGNPKFTKNDEYILSTSTSDSDTNAYITIIKLTNSAWTPNINSVGSILNPSSTATKIGDEEVPRRIVGYTADYSSVLNKILITRGFDLSIYGIDIVGETINFNREKQLRIRRNRCY